MRGFGRSTAIGRAGAALSVGFAALAGAAAALAQEDASGAGAAVVDSGDTAWMLTATVLVLMMTIPGLALFYAGMVRKMNSLAMLMQSFAICCLASVLWMVAGYSLAFGAGNAFVGDLGNLFLSGLGVDAVFGTIPESVFMTFQMTFAIITPALITGAFADRMKFSALLLFTTLWLLLVYAPLCHMVWGGGLLGRAGFRRRHSGAHQRRHRRAGRRRRARPAQRLRQDALSAA